jgi:hypothetical protein
MPYAFMPSLIVDSCGFAGFGFCFKNSRSFSFTVRFRVLVDRSIKSSESMKAKKIFKNDNFEICGVPETKPAKKQQKKPTTTTTTTTIIDIGCCGVVGVSSTLSYSIHHGL